MMKDLDTAILSLLGSHPDIHHSSAKDVKYARPYVTKLGVHIALEPRNKKSRNLWVSARAVRLANFPDLDPKLYDYQTFASHKPNHDLFRDGSFPETEDVVRFKIKTPWDAARVIAEAAGLGGKL
jgi:hypothetical protein